MVCKKCGKPNKIAARGMCNNCYKKEQRDSRPKIPCQCKNPLCFEMIPPISRDGRPNRFAYGHNMYGDNNPRFNNYEYKNTKGYKMVKVENHPYATKEGYYQYHRLVIEKKLGRILRPDEVIHHIDGNIDNNDESNLMILDAGTHTRLHHKKDMTGRKCVDPDCISPLETQKDNDGNPCWFKWKDGTFLCKRCYSRMKKRESDAKKKADREKNKED